jgi:glycerol kinase
MSNVHLVVAHIAGIPIEETVLMAVPALGAAYVAIMASLRARRRSWKQD